MLDSNPRRVGLDDSIAQLIAFLCIYSIPYLASTILLRLIGSKPILALDAAMFLLFACLASASAAYIQKHLGRTLCRLFVSGFIGAVSVLHFLLPSYTEFIPACLVALSDATPCQDHQICVIEWMLEEPRLSCCRGLAIVRADVDDAKDSEPFLRQLNEALGARGIGDTAASIEATYRLGPKYLLLVYTSG